ncbi:MAG TPA: hydrolase [Micromonosporaceae bacterium]|nr:hydrolase [Micromonosporaceae bacterium]
MHLVWDWNGTLLNDLDVVVSATNAAFVKAGGSAITAEHHRRRFRRPISDFYAEALGRELTGGEFELLDETFHQSYRDGLATVELTPDARAAIAAWPGTQSLLSMWFHEELVPMVDHFQLTFTRIDGFRKEFGAGTFKADHLKRHLEALGVSGPQAVLIGDSVDDAHAAAAVSAHCVLYSGGFTHEESLLTCGVPVEHTLEGAVRRALCTF